MKLSLALLTVACFAATGIKAQTNQQDALVDVLVHSLEINNLLYLYEGDTLYIALNDPTHPASYYYANETVKVLPKEAPGREGDTAYYLDLEVKTGNKVDFRLQNLEQYHGYFKLADQTDELVVADLQYIITTN